MAGEQERLRKYQDLRTKIEKYIPQIVDLLRTPEKISPDSFGSDELRELKEIITKLHEYRFIQNNPSLQSVWNSRFNTNETIDNFFRQANLNPESLTYLYTYLWISSSELEGQIVSDNGELQRLEEQLKQVQEAVQAAAPPKVEAKPVTDAEKQAQAIKEKQRASVERAKAAYLIHQKELARINALLPPGRQLEKIDFDNLTKLASDSSFAPLNIETFFDRYGVTSAIGRENTTALSLLKQYFVSLRHKNLQVRKTEGLSTKVFPSQDMQEAVSELSRTYGNRVVTLAYTATGKQLKEMGTTPDGKTDVEVAIAREIRRSSLGILWQPDSGAKRLIKGFTGQTKREQDQLLKDIGLIGAEEVEIKRPRLFEEFLVSGENYAVVDLVGIPEEVYVSEFEFEGAPSVPEKGVTTTPPARRLDPQTISRNADRLKTVAQGARAIAANPALIGVGVGAAGVGTVVAGIIAQAPGVMGVGGAVVGGTIGFFVGGPLGAVIGAAIGGVGTYAVGQAAFGGGVGLVLPVGITPPTAGGILGTAGTQAAPTISAGLNAGVSGATKVASNVIGGTSQFISGTSAAPSILSTAAGSTAVTAAPLAVAGVLTVVGASAMFGAFLTPPDRLNIASEQSRYVEIVKTPTYNAEGLDAAGNPTKDVPIVYRITIKPRLGPDGKTPYIITVKEAKDVFRLTSKTPNLPTPISDAKLDPGPLPIDGKDFSYSITIPTTFKDTRISNTFTLTFDVSGPETAANQIASAYASVSFGNPPSDLGCFVFENATTVPGRGVATKDWTEQEKAIVADAFAITEPYPHYRDLVCTKNGQTVPVKIYRLSGYSFGGWTLSPDSFGMYDLSFGNARGPYGRGTQVLEARYTLIHESGHIIQHRSSEANQSYLSSGSALIPTYGYYGCNSCAASWRESMAETIAVFTLFHNRSFLVSGSWIKFDMPARVPANYAWARDYVFQGDPP